MKVEQFAMERMQSTWENLVDFNLSESGVHPLTPRELVGESGLDAVLDQPLVYTQSNGTPELRTRIADLYPGATADHVQVTNGGSEANYISVWRLVEPGDEVAMLVPNYMQTWGLVRAFGGTVREWPLIEDRAAGRWRPDLDQLAKVVSERTRAIIICTPNNPTGARLTAAELDRDRGDRGASRLVGDLGRGVSRRRARRRGVAVDVGPLRSRHRDERPVEGVRAARTPHWLDHRAALAGRVHVVVSRLHDHRAGRPQRSARACGVERGQAPRPSRAHPRHPAREPAGHRGLAARP